MPLSRAYSMISFTSSCVYTCEYGSYAPYNNHMTLHCKQGKSTAGKNLTNHLAQLGKNFAFVGKRLVIHNMPMKDVKLVVSHSILKANKQRAENKSFANALMTSAEFYQVLEEDLFADEVPRGIKQYTSVRKPRKVRNRRFVDDKLHIK